MGQLRAYVGGVGRNVRESTDGGNGHQVGLELLGGNLGNSVGRTLGRLERKQVGEETSDVRGGHGSARDDVGGGGAADPGGEDVKTRGEDVVALAVVGEVSTLIGESAGTDGDGLLGSGRRVSAGVGVVVAGSDGEVDTGIDSSVDSLVKNGGLATTQAHVGSAALELLVLASLGRLNLVRVSLSGVLYTLDDVGHGARTVGSENLDGVDIGLLCNTVLLASDSARAVSTVSVAVLVLVTLRDGLAPFSAALEVDVVDVGAGVNDIDINALTTLGSVEVLVEGTESKAVAVGDAGETPRSVLLNLWAGESVHNLVLLDVGNLW